MIVDARQVETKQRNTTKSVKHPPRKTELRLFRPELCRFPGYFHYQTSLPEMKILIAGISEIVRRSLVNIALDFYTRKTYKGLQ